MKRREFLITSAAALSFLLSGCAIGDRVMEEPLTPKPSPPRKSVVYVLKTEERDKAVRKLMQNFSDFEGSTVGLKANYNSADPFPASTHLNTLSAIVDVLKEQKAEIFMAERSGMGNTSSVLKTMGVLDLAREKGFTVVDLDSYDGWVLHQPEDSHWKNGYPFADIFLTVDSVIQTCCLKTHRFGGHFTMSLKNSVGMVAKRWRGHDYMSELHNSPHMRKMIAEINVSYSPEIAIMDAIKGFSHGGPERGTLIEPGLLIASNDRVAIDAVGVALLRIHGTTPEVSRGDVFEQQQIARAIEIGLSSGKFEVVPVNVEADEICSEIEGVLWG